MGTRRGHGEGEHLPAEERRPLRGGRRLRLRERQRASARSISGTTRKEAAEKLKAQLRDQQQGLPPVRDGRSVGNQRLATVSPTVVRPKTTRIYEHYLVDLKPALGRHQLSKLTKPMVQVMVNDLAGLRPHTVRLARYLEERARPGRRLGSGASQRGDAGHLATALRRGQRASTAEQARALLAAVRGDRLEALYTVAVAMGLRQREALGLRWQDIDLTNRRLQVEVALQRVDGTLTLVEVEDGDEPADVRLPQVVIRALQEHRDRQACERLVAGERWEETDLVFTTRTAGRWRRGT